MKQKDKKTFQALRNKPLTKLLRTQLRSELITTKQTLDWIALSHYTMQNYDSYFR